MYFLLLSPGVAEAGGQGGLTLTQILAEQKAPPGSSSSTPHYYLPTQIFRPFAIPGTGLNGGAARI